MGSSYYLGWPGLESAPVHVIDIKTHKIYNVKNKLPKKQKYLNKLENRYIELSWIVNRFPLPQQQTALNVLMKLVGDLSLPKFYVGPNNVAYVPLDTVVTFVICHPHNPAFSIARCAVIAYLQNYFELPCKTCGFIIRECQCHVLHPELTNINREHFIGIGTEIKSTGVQCGLLQSANMQVSTDPLHNTDMAAKDPLSASGNKLVVLPGTPPGGVVKLRPPGPNDPRLPLPGGFPSPAGLRPGKHWRAPALPICPCGGSASPWTTSCS